LEARERKDWPSLLRGDLAWGSESAMVEVEVRQLPYLFKLRQSQGARLKISQLAREEGWRNAGDGWHGMEDKVRLRGWTRARRI